MLLSSCLGQSLPPQVFSWNGLICVLLAGGSLLAGSQLAGYGMTRVSASSAGIILTLESPFAIVLGLLLYQELPGLDELMGGALITFGVCLCIEKQKKARSVRSPAAPAPSAATA